MKRQSKKWEKTFGTDVPEKGLVFKIYAAAAKLLQSCLTLCDPVDGSPPGSPIPGAFSRQEYWSGLSFPPPMHESESDSHSVVSNSLEPHELYSPWNSRGQNTGVGSLSLLQGDLPNSGIKPRSPAFQMDSLPAEPQVKPKNTGVGSLSLLQQIFATQESEQGYPALQVVSLPTELSGRPC